MSLYSQGMLLVDGVRTIQSLITAVAISDGEKNGGIGQLFVGM